MSNQNLDSRIKILFVSDSYKNRPTANGICVEEIINGFGADKYEIHVLCIRQGNELEDEKISGVYVHRIKADLVHYLRHCYESRKRGMSQTVFHELMRLVNRIETFFFMGLFPMRNPLFALRFAQKLDRLYKKYSFDCVIASYCPFESVYAAYKLKCNVNTVFYFLDSISNQKVAIRLPEGFLDRTGWNWEKRFFTQADMVLNMDCHRKHYENTRYEDFRIKMEIVDIPHMIYHKVSNRENREKALVIVYAGAIRENLITDTIDILAPFLTDGNAELHFYGRNPVLYIESYCRKKHLKNVFFEGAIPHDEMIEIESRADVLLNMGNTDMDFTPSKIFEYMSFGGKILHVYRDTQDSCLPYFAKYPNSCCINVNENFDVNIDKVKAFINAKADRVPFGAVENFFELNTPQYTISKIQKVIEGLSWNEKK